MMMYNNVVEISEAALFFARKCLRWAVFLD